jgi:hypothetical protein
MDNEIIRTRGLNYNDKSALMCEAELTPKCIGANLLNNPVTQEYTARAVGKQLCVYIKNAKNTLFSLLIFNKFF